jgi:hypothetical protein
MKRGTLVVVAVALGVVLALLICGGVGLFGVAVFATNTGSAPARHAARCSEEPQKRTIDLYVCSESTSTRDVALVDSVGAPIATLSSNTRIVRLHARQGQPEEIRRKPGRVDVRVCVLDSGQVGYVRNTYIRGGLCD